MKRIIGVVVLAAALGGCATSQSLEDAWAPNAMVRWWENKCENQTTAVSAATPMQRSVSPVTVPAAAADTDRDIRSRVYFNCVRDWP